MATATVRTRARRQAKKQPPESRREGVARIVLASALLLFGVGAAAQQTMIEPSVSATLRYSDNVGAESDRGEDWMAEIAPAIAVRRESGRFRGSLDASLRNVAYARESERNDSFLSLQGTGEVEAVERLLFLDLEASISRSNRSLFGGRASGDPLETASDTETRRYGLGPRLQFRIGPEITGSAQYMTRWQEGSGDRSRSRQSDAAVELSNPQQFGRVGWGLAYQRSDSDYDNNPRNTATQESVRGIVFVTVTPQLRLRGIVGHESNDYEFGSREESEVVGGGVDWFPTDRTSIAATTEKRVFGQGYDVSISHRRPLSVWNLAFSRDIESTASAGDAVFADPAFRSLFNALEATIPDPLEREAAVRRQLGYPPIGQRSTFVTDAHFVNRDLSGSVALIGSRNVLTLSLLRSDRSRLGTPDGLNPGDDFGLFADIESRSASVAWSHRLSGLSSLTGVLLWMKTEGSGGTRATVRRALYSLAYQRQLSPDSTAGLAYTYQRADGSTDFIENVLMATFSMRF